LAWFAQRALQLIKINAVELRTLFGEMPVADALAEAAIQSPVARWVVSDGPNAVWFRGETGAADYLVPPVVREVSATGSGDVLLACLLVSLFGRRMTLREAVKESLPLAAANAAHGGIAEFP